MAETHQWHQDPEILGVGSLTPSGCWILCAGLGGARKPPGGLCFPSLLRHLRGGPSCEPAPADPETEHYSSETGFSALETGAGTSAGAVAFLPISQESLRLEPHYPPPGGPVAGTCVSGGCWTSAAPWGKGRAWSKSFSHGSGLLDFPATEWQTFYSVSGLKGACKVRHFPAMLCDFPATSEIFHFPASR